MGRTTFGVDTQDLPSLPTSPPVVAGSRPSQSPVAAVGGSKSLMKSCPVPNPTTSCPDSPPQMPPKPKQPPPSSPLITNPGKGSPSPSREVVGSHGMAEHKQPGRGGVGEGVSRPRQQHSSTPTSKAAQELPWQKEKPLLLFCFCWTRPVRQRMSLVNLFALIQLKPLCPQQPFQLPHDWLRQGTLLSDKGHCT